MQHESYRRRRFLLLSLSPLYFLIISFFIQPFEEILQGLVAIVESPDFLITDYFVVGGPGAALFNASLSTLLCILIIYLLGVAALPVLNLDRGTEGARLAVYLLLLL
ncbi:MAG TPA: DUF1576 domain-containing protein, partial [Candidatus Avoscillospira avistercoris]|nr:DUF1576 domain-containing protein [Candidatus Avoscillospira avistercoris]